MNISERDLANPFLKFRTDNQDIQFPCEPEIYSAVFSHYEKSQVEAIKNLQISGTARQGQLSLSLKKVEIDEARKYTELFQSIHPSTETSSFTNCICEWDLPWFKGAPENEADKKTWDNTHKYLPAYKRPYILPCDKALKKIDKAEELEIKFGKFILTADILSKEKKLGEIKFTATQRRITPKDSIEHIKWFKTLSFEPKK